MIRFQGNASAGSAFPISLVFPPQGHFTQPYLALPCLKAWLQARGFADVELVDASVEAYDRFLSAEYLAFAAERVERNLSLSRFEALSELPFAEMDAYRAAVESAVSSASLVQGVEAAKRVIRGEEFFETEKYVGAMRTLYHGLRLVSAAWFPSRLTPHNFTMAYSIDRSEQVLAATQDEEQNPFIEHFRAELLPALVRRRPRVLGMSVIYGSQLIPALTLGRLVKAALPDCHVTAGGGFLAYIGKKLMAAPGIDACLDSLVFHEGETPLEELCTALREHGPAADLSSVGSLTWFRRAGSTAATAGRVQTVENPAGHPLRLDDAPLPDFDGLPLERYFSPEVVLPYDVNRGCYYGECTFCTLPTVIGPGYRTRRAETIAEQVIALRDRYDTRNFNFITDCLPPGMIRELPQQLLAQRADIRWWCDARVEPKAYTPEGARRLYEAGCRKLLFGFETATPRLLKLMQKGQSPRATLEVARNCAEAGISVTFYAMVGFPTETPEEARDTLRFITENSDVVREVSLQTFHIDEVAKTYREAASFGIEILDEPGADLQLYHDYVSASGMTQTEAAELFEEMMAGFRRSLPIFAGDNVLYFMQKSHYFLHLARDVHPDEFVQRCRARTEAADARRTRPGLKARAGLRTARLPFSYAAVVQRLGHPLARAVRPDFLTGRYVDGALKAAEAELGSLPREERVLAYAGGGSEFAELRSDGERALRALAAAGDLGSLLDGLPDDAHNARANLNGFAAHLHRLGLLADEQAEPVRAWPVASRNPELVQEPTR